MSACLATELGTARLDSSQIWSLRYQGCSHASRFYWAVPYFPSENGEKCHGKVWLFFIVNCSTSSGSHYRYAEVPYRQQDLFRSQVTSWPEVSVLCSSTPLLRKNYPCNFRWISVILWGWYAEPQDRFEEYGTLSFTRKNLWILYAPMSSSSILTGICAHEEKLTARMLDGICANIKGVRLAGILQKVEMKRDAKWFYR